MRLVRYNQSARRLLLATHTKGGRAAGRFIETRKILIASVYSIIYCHTFRRSVTSQCADNKIDTDQILTTEMRKKQRWYDQ
jgi:hypothetical protein